MNGPLTERCPRCDANPGEPCVMVADAQAASGKRRGEPRDPHASRYPVRGHGDGPRSDAACGECGQPGAQPAPAVAGRDDGMLCRRCWWRLNRRAS